MSLCFIDSSTWSIYSLSHGQSEQSAQHLVPSHTKNLWALLKYSLTTAGKSTKLSNTSSRVKSHGRNRDTKERGEKHILAGGILGAFSSASPTAIQTKRQQGSLWPTFPPLHGILCHCETATEFQLHNDDERDLKQPHAVQLTERWQPLPWHPCLLPGRLCCTRLQLPRGAEVQGQHSSRLRQ